jgi:hypothetical protein
MDRLDSFNRLVTALRAAPDVEHGAGASEQDLAELRQLFTPLPPDFDAYLRRYGWIRIGSVELFGLGEDVPSYLDIIERCLAMRAGQLGWELPPEFLCFGESGAEWIYCLWAAPAGATRVVMLDLDEATGQVQVIESEFATWSEFVLDLTGLAEAVASQPQTVSCPNCRAVVRSDRPFCTNCGHRLA